MSHLDLDRASLEMAREIARRLRANPELIEVARENLARWTKRNVDSPALLSTYAEWQRLLELPVAEICAILTEESDEGQRLRQNSPFPGILSPKEVWAIKARHKQT